MNEDDITRDRKREVKMQGRRETDDTNGVRKIQQLRLWISACRLEMHTNKGVKVKRVTKVREKSEEMRMAV